MGLRIALFGQAAFGRDVALRLAEAGHELVAVHVPPDKGPPDPLAAEARARSWALHRHRSYRPGRQARPPRDARATGRAPEPEGTPGRRPGSPTAAQTGQT